jgi:glutathione S-transferase
MKFLQDLFAENYNAENFFVLAGPCVVESRAVLQETAETLVEVCSELKIPLVFKSSYTKANRSSVNSFTGIGNEKALEKARSHIRDRLTQLAPVFLKNKFMMGDNFSMLDVAIAPLLWRLEYYGIDLSKNAAPLLKYAERIFSRPAYIEALTPSEKVMRK